ncbi:uncharacterized protein [Argopecten irradians]|uniref:uncharacterized protein isoform X1 n=1 Tax=Argopecten irradians TaxID=31199 RepID=UPI00371F26AE
MDIILVQLLIAGTLVLGVTGTNLLTNGDFEGPKLWPHWRRSGCSWAISTTEYRGGAQSVSITGRSAKWSGLGKVLNISDGIAAGKIYAFSGYIKLGNLAPASSYHKVEVVVRHKFNDDSLQYVSVSVQPFAQPGSWVEIGGDFKLPNNIKEIKIYIQIAEPEVNYFFDDASLVELVPDMNWKATADNNIYNNRKVNFDIITHKEQGISLSDFTIEVEQKRSEFGHGTAVRASLWADPAYGFYRDFVYNTLKSEWAVIENALKWRQMEWTEGKLKFDDANATIDDLLSNGLSVRGHNIVWGVDERIPNWVQAIMDQEVMKAAIYKRLSSTAKLTKGRLVHWDVNNEVLHGDFFERKTGNVDITMDMFRNMSVADPNAKLFINDYAVLSSGTYTTAITNQAKAYLAAGLPLHGIGVQNHLQSSIIDITQLKYRLDKMAEAGLPLWITEMSINETNVATKAYLIEDILNLCFGHNAVKGVMLWGFWSEAIWKPNAALATGIDSISLNEAGRRYVNLVNTVWRTNWSGALQTYTDKRYFKGDYSIRVKKDGVTLKTIEVNLPSKSELVLTIGGTNASPTIAVQIN